MKPNPKWRMLVQKYYKQAPDIAWQLESHPERQEVCEKLYHKFLQPCLHLIKEQRYGDAIKIYQYMTLYCQERLSKPLQKL